MAGERVKLSKSKVDALQPKEKTFNVMDSEVRGFGVQVQPQGVKTYFLKYVHQGRQAWITIGKHGKELTLEKARDLARLHRGDIAHGRNPAGEKRAAREGATMKELGAQFLEEHVKTKLKPKTQAVYEWNLEKYIYPAIGSKKVKTLEVADVRALHHKLRKLPRSANMVLNILSRMLGLAEQWGYRAQNSNPCPMVERFHESKRVCRLEDEELEALGRAMAEEEANPATGPLPMAMIRLLLFTGARRGEVLSLRLDELDLTPGRECIRKAEHKTDRVSGTKVIALNPRALAVLATIPRVLGNPRVFPYNTVVSAETALKRAWDRVRVAAELKHVRIHDLRHIHASVAIDAGVSEEVIGGMLGQKTREVTARYAHLGKSPVKQGTDVVGSALEEKLAKGIS
jgi:integrase